jgi:hypothetical protein
MYVEGRGFDPTAPCAKKADASDSRSARDVATQTAGNDPPIRLRSKAPFLGLPSESLK